MTDNEDYNASVRRRMAERPPPPDLAALLSASKGHAATAGKQREANTVAATARKRSRSEDGANDLADDGTGMETGGTSSSSGEAAVPLPAEAKQADKRIKTD
ncbi:hypothetical protein HK405_011665 [Cladochytrium tenue]|nr:hypothetical protein HK405_011665 [Cladochytrium tenue]